MDQFLGGRPMRTRLPRRTNASDASRPLLAELKICQRSPPTEKAGCLSANWLTVRRVRGGAGVLCAATIDSISLTPCTIMFNPQQRCCLYKDKMEE